MFKRLGFSFIVAFFGLVTNANAQTASITLSEKSAQVGYGFLVGGSNYGRTELKAEFLYNSDETYMIDASLQVFDEVGSQVQGLVAGLGGKLYGASVAGNRYEILVLGVGGMLRYAIPQNKRIILGVDGYYSPQIVSFIDAERFYDVAARLEYELLPTASAYVEYRKYLFESTADNEGGIIIERGFRLGMELTF